MRGFCKLYVFLVIFMLVLVSSSVYAGDTLRVSVSSAGVQAVESSANPSISADGRFVAFESDDADLVSGDTNGYTDIFVRDIQEGITERVSVSTAGVQGNNKSITPSISADGRFVAFSSYAGNLVSGDTNGFWDVFVYDRDTNTIQRISVSSLGDQANGHSEYPSISADGKFVAFDSNASNLVSGDTNRCYDIFVYDIENHTTQRVSVSSAGAQALNHSYNPSINENGSVVAFQSIAGNLVSGDTNNNYDIFVRNIQAGTTERVSVSSAGAQSNSNSYNSSISADGNLVTFYSYASNLVSDDTNGHTDIFVYSILSDETKRVSVSSEGMQTNNDSFNPSISANGRFVVFQSIASNLVSGDTNLKSDIFVYDMQTCKTQCVSVSGDGVQANNLSSYPSISADGRFVAFQSVASNLVPGDTNGDWDIFVHERTGISGTIILSGYNGDITTIPVTVSINDVPHIVYLDSDGKFTILDITYGTYDISIKASHWLTKVLKCVVVD